MHVAEFCSRSVDTTTVDETVRDAARRMNDRNVGALVVVDPHGSPVGIVTDRDITLRVTAVGLDAGTTTVGEVMTPKPVTVAEDTTIGQALDAMRAATCRRLPIVDARKHVTGIFSLDDMLMATFGLLDGVQELLREESPQSLARS